MHVTHQPVLPGPTYITPTSANFLNLLNLRISDSRNQETKSEHHAIILLLIHSFVHFFPHFFSFLFPFHIKVNVVFCLQVQCSVDKLMPNSVCRAVEGLVMQLTSHLWALTRQERFLRSILCLSGQPASLHESGVFRLVSSPEILCQVLHQFSFLLPCSKNWQTRSAIRICLVCDLQYLSLMQY